MSSPENGVKIDFSDSNYPVKFALPEEDKGYKASWKGRMVDRLLEHKGRNHIIQALVYSIIDKIIQWTLCRNPLEKKEYLNYKTFLAHKKMTEISQEEEIRDLCKNEIQELRDKSQAKKKPEEDPKDFEIQKAAARSLLKSRLKTNDWLPLSEKKYRNRIERLIQKVETQVQWNSDEFLQKKLNLVNINDDNDKIHENVMYLLEGCNTELKKVFLGIVDKKEALQAVKEALEQKINKHQNEKNKLEKEKETAIKDHLNIQVKAIKDDLEAKKITHQEANEYLTGIVKAYRFEELNKELAELAPSKVYQKTTVAIDNLLNGIDKKDEPQIQNPDGNAVNDPEIVAKTLEEKPEVVIAKENPQEPKELEEKQKVPAEIKQSQQILDNKDAKTKDQSNVEVKNPEQKPEIKQAESKPGFFAKLWGKKPSQKDLKEGQATDNKGDIPKETPKLEEKLPEDQKPNPGANPEIIIPPPKITADEKPVTDPKVNQAPNPEVIIPQITETPKDDEKKQQLEDPSNKPQASEPPNDPNKPLEVVTKAPEQETLSKEQINKLKILFTGMKDKEFNKLIKYITVSREEYKETIQKMTLTALQTEEVEILKFIAYLGPKMTTNKLSKNDFDQLKEKSDLLYQKYFDLNSQISAKRNSKKINPILKRDT